MYGVSMYSCVEGCNLCALSNMVKPKVERKTSCNYGKFVQPVGKGLYVTSNALPNIALAGRTAVIYSHH